MDEGTKNIDLPYLKDAATSTITKEGSFSAEYMFWKEFLKDSKQLLPEFEHRASEAEKAGQTTISWINLIPGCCTRQSSMKQQYLVALSWAHDCIEGVCNQFKKNAENLKALKSLAESVVYMRQQTLEKYDTEIENAKAAVAQTHREMDAKQSRIIEIKNLLREMNKQSEDTCIHSHEKKTMRQLEKESKQAMLDLEKLRVTMKEADENVKLKMKDKQYRMRVVALWRSIHSATNTELKKLEPDAA